ncbi:MAG: 50S ribosomal protein L6 [Candidatus Nanohaloarchaea archaeon]|nr:50S ribosomal protein L6 [Candidatus Nanohaloarchaea archaeon]
MEQQVTVPEDVDVDISDGTVTVSAGDTSVERTLDHPDISITVDGDTVTVATETGRRDTEALVGTYASHIQNMVHGVSDGFEYHMQGFYSHFPMDMAVEGDTFVISNFIGERSTREVAIPPSVEIEIDGEDVILRGADKEAVGQTAANIEQACYKGDRDPRKFQDGVYITERGVRSSE